jgi:hypothetical protein
MTQEELKPYTFGELVKEKNKKFLFRFGTKTINKIKTPVVYYNYEYKDKRSQLPPGCLRLNKHWNVFQGVLLRNIGCNYEIIYEGRMNKKFKVNWQDFKNSVEEFYKMEEIDKEHIQYEFPFHMLNLNQDPKLFTIFEKLENLRYVYQNN